MLAQAPIEIPLAPPPGPAANVVLPVPFIAQVEGNWCWAACASMVLARYGQNVNQCKIAEFVLQVSCCPDPDVCDTPRPPGVVAQIYQHFNLQANAKPGPISLLELQTELSAGRPVEVGVGGCAGGTSSNGHLLVVYGWVSGTTFLVHDPFDQGTGPVDYQWLLTDRGCWRETWTNLQPAP